MAEQPSQLKNAVKRPKKPPTERQKAIIQLKKLKDDGKASETQLAQYLKLQREERAGKLSTLATARVNKIITGIAALARLSRLRPSTKQRELVFTVIKEAVERAYAKWEGVKDIDAGEFQLDAEPVSE
jgi:hypothetical protein